jgi:capsular exopolysaccharide synthesis family protein
VLLVFVATMLVTWMQTKVYASTTAVLVETPLAVTSSASPVAPDMTTEKQVAESGAVAQLVAQRHHFKMPLSELSKGLSVGEPFEANILDFTYSGTNPREAELISQAFANAYIEFRQQVAMDQLSQLRVSIEEEIGSLTKALNQVVQFEGAASSNQQAQATAEAAPLITQMSTLVQQLSNLTPTSVTPSGKIVEDAQLPRSPAHPKLLLNAFVGLLLGCVLGLGGAMAWEYFDDRVRGATDLESRLEVPVLTTLPRVRQRGSSLHDLILLGEPDSTEAERFRQLRTNLVLACLQNDVSSILVTSAAEAEGKTFVAANLSVALAQAGKQVILISANLRHPRLEETFRVLSEVGLLDALAGKVSWRNALLKTGMPKLSFLPTGSGRSSSTELLASDSMAALLREMCREVDYIIVDSCALLSAADASVIVPACDGVLFVASARKTTRNNIARAREQLARVHGTVLGAILLDVQEKEVFWSSGASWGNSSWGEMRGNGRQRSMSEAASVDPLKSWP